MGLSVLRIHIMLRQVMRVGSTERPTIVLVRHLGLSPNSCEKNLPTDQKETDCVFVKDLFLGRVNSKIFDYPSEPDSKDLCRRFHQVKKYMDTQVKSENIDKDGFIPQETVDVLRDFGLFGLRVPPNYGGLGLSALECCYMRKATSCDSSISDLLFSHDALGLQGILLHGNEQQKKSYLQKLSNGEWIIALGLAEDEYGFDIKMVRTRASLSEDGSYWKITGTKKWVVNAPIADVFIVLVVTEVKNRLGLLEDKLAVFIVEKDFGYVSVGTPTSNLGKRGIAVCEVTFKDTPVPKENLLGNIGDGFKITSDILYADLFSRGCMAAGLLKQLTHLTISSLEKKVTPGSAVPETLVTPRRLAEVVSRIYAMESLSFLTAGLMDKYLLRDHLIESASVKVFSNENLWLCLNEFLALLGKGAFEEGSVYERIFRDSRTTTLPFESNEGSKILVALSGLQHASETLNNEIYKVQNPLFYPGYLIKKYFWNLSPEEKLQRQSQSESVVIKHVHPSLKKPAGQLGCAVQQLKQVTYSVLVRHASNIYEHEEELCRIGNIAVNIYAMAAVIARASHSCSNHLEDSEFEILLAELFCSSVLSDITLDAADVVAGFTHDYYKRKIAHKIFKFKDYFVQHPLTMNF